MGDFSGHGLLHADEINVHPLVGNQSLLAGVPGFLGPRQEFYTLNRRVSEVAFVVQIEQEDVKGGHVYQTDLVVVNVIH